MAGKWAAAFSSAPRRRRSGHSLPEHDCSSPVPCRAAGASAAVATYLPAPASNPLTSPASPKPLEFTLRPKRHSSFSSFSVLLVEQIVIHAILLVLPNHYEGIGWNFAGNKFQFLVRTELFRVEQAYIVFLWGRIVDELSLTADNVVIFCVNAGGGICSKDQSSYRLVHYSIF